MIKQISMKIAWLLVIGLALSLTFTACSDDVIGPRVQDEESEEKEEKHDEGGGMTMAEYILHSPGSGQEICLSKRLA